MPQHAGAGEIGSPEWLAARVSEQKRKRAVLDALRDSLAEWEQGCHWETLSPDKQHALTRLAEESVAALRSLISRLEAELAGQPACGTGRHD